MVHFSASKREELRVPSGYCGRTSSSETAMIAHVNQTDALLQSAPVGNIVQDSLFIISA